MLFSGAASEDLSIDADTLYIDSSTNRVGIANNSPSVALDVTGAAKISSTLDLTSHLDMPDSAIIKLGTGDDLQIYHDGTNSIIADAGDGGLKLMVAGTANNGFYKYGSSEVLATFEPDGPVTLYHNDSAKLATASGGVSITGQLDLSSHLDMPDSAYIKLGTGDDLQLYHDGSDSYISDAGTGILKIKGSEIRMQTTSGENMAIFNPDGSVQLQYDNSTKLATASGGVTVTGYLTASGHVSTGTDTGYLRAGASNDIQLYHDGSHSYLKSDTGNFIADVAGDITLDADGSQVFFKDDGTTRYTFNLDATPDLVMAGGNASITASTQDADFTIIGNDGGSDINALTFDMSDAGTATFNHDVVVSGNLNFGNPLTLQASGNDAVVTNTTGNMYLQTDSTLRITDVGNNETHAIFNDNGAVTLYHDNSTKLATASDGVDITGDVGATTATIAGNITQTSGDYLYSAGTNFNIKNTIAEQNITFDTTPSGGSATERMRVKHDGKVGIGNASPSQALDLQGYFKMGNSRTDDAEKHAKLMGVPYDSGGTSDIAGLYINGHSGGNYLRYGGGVDATSAATTHTFYTAALTTGAYEGTHRLHIAADGKIGMGTTTPSTNHSKANNLVVGSGSAGGMAVYNGTAEGWYAFSRDNANNSDAYDGGISYNGDRQLKFHTNAGGTRMMLNSDGLHFGSDTAAANALDDYEEGTFTPTYTVGGGGSVTGVTSTNVGTYTKVGRMCTVSVTSNYVGTSGTIPTYYNLALPFTAADTASGMTGGGFGQETGQSGAGMLIKVEDNQTNAIIWKYDGGAVPANSYFSLSFTYQTA